MLALHPTLRLQLRTERNTWQTLVTLLQGEQVTLGTAAPEHLPELTGSKGEVLTRLTAMKRERHLRFAGARVRRRLASHQDADVRALWNEIVALGRAAYGLNRINGALVNMRLGVTRRARLRTGVGDAERAS